MFIDQLSGDSVVKDTNHDENSSGSEDEFNSLRRITSASRDETTTGMYDTNGSQILILFCH